MAAIPIRLIPQTYSQDANLRRSFTLFIGVNNVFRVISGNTESYPLHTMASLPKPAHVYHSVRILFRLLVRTLYRPFVLIQMLLREQPRLDSNQRNTGVMAEKGG